MSTVTKSRAKKAILWYIMQFCVAHRFEDKLIGFRHGFNNTFDVAKARIGDLVIPTCSPISEWYLSWLVEITPAENGVDTIYTLESIETGNLCNWSNIGIKFLDRDIINAHPEWKWTDRQFAFKDRWLGVCRKNDNYITLPIQPLFGEGFQVTLGTRAGFGFDDYAPRKTFDDWRKLTKKMMGEYYNKCASEHPTPVKKPVSDSGQ